MIGTGAKSITILRAVTADFFFDWRAAEVPSDEWIRDVPWGVHNHAQDLRLESFQNFNVGGGSSAQELYTVGPDGLTWNSAWFAVHTVKLQTALQSAITFSSIYAGLDSLIPLYCAVRSRLYQCCGGGVYGKDAGIVANHLMVLM
jgi:hypothetical protein